MTHENVLGRLDHLRALGIRTSARVTGSPHRRAPTEGGTDLGSSRGGLLWRLYIVLFAVGVYLFRRFCGRLQPGDDVIGIDLLARPVVRVDVDR